MLHDGHGSTRVLLDGNETDAAFMVLQRYAYEAFGNMLGDNGMVQASAALTTLLFSGEQTDATGLQYLRARYYNPSSGRFNRLDPFAGNLLDPQSLHKYLYTHADPVNNIDPTGEFSLVGTLATGLSVSLKALTVINAARLAKKALTDGIDALSLWDWLSIIPFGGVGAVGKFLGSGTKGLKTLALQHPSTVRILHRFGDDIANVIGRNRGWVSGNLGTRVHEAFKSTRIGGAITWLQNVLRNNNSVRITFDTSIFSGGGPGSRPDITIQFPKFKFAIALDIKPVPEAVFDKGWLASIAHLYNSTSPSIQGRREGTVKIFEEEFGYKTLYLYIPYPSFFQ